MVWELLNKNVTRKDEYLKKDGYHHTSKFYNTTDFYKVDIEKILENTFSKEKYLDEKQSPLKNFYDVHKNFIEKEPEQYSGERTIKGVLNYLGSKNNKTAEIKTPIENVTVSRNDVKHLLEDNEKERSNYINRFVRTLQAPNLIIETTENEKIYNYYIKSFKKENDLISGHIQIIKKCPDGNFYVTNHHLRNSKFNKVLKNGQIIYDLSDLSVMQNASDNNSITDVGTDFNPNVKNNVSYQEINPEQQNIFPGNRKAKEIHKVKGGYLPADKFIELFKNADASTIVHELAHWYLDELTRVAEYNDEIAQDLEAVNIKSK